MSYREEPLIEPISDEERRFLASLEGGLIRPEFAQARAQLLLQTRSGVASVLVSPESKGLITFSEVKEILREVGMDLEKAKKEAIAAYVRWGVLKPKRLLFADDLVTIERQFDAVQLNTQDVLEVRNRIARGEKMSVIFDVGNMAPEELFKTIILNAGIRCVGHEFLGKLREIDLAKVPGIATLDKIPIKDQERLFREAYKHGRDIKKTGKARVVFSPAVIFPEDDNFIATTDAREIVEGKVKLLDINAALLRFRMEAEHGMEAMYVGTVETWSPDEYRGGLDKYLIALTREYMEKSEAPTVIARLSPHQIYPNGWVGGLANGCNPYGQLGMFKCEPGWDFQRNQRSPHSKSKKGIYNSGRSIMLG